MVMNMRNCGNSHSRIQLRKIQINIYRILRNFKVSSEKLMKSFDYFDDFEAIRKRKFALNPDLL
jgi:hypothetical protein